MAGRHPQSNKRGEVMNYLRAHQGQSLSISDICRDVRVYSSTIRDTITLMRQHGWTISCERRGQKYFYEANAPEEER